MLFLLLTSLVLLLSVGVDSNYYEDTYPFRNRDYECSDYRCLSVPSRPRDLALNLKMLDMDKRQYPVVFASWKAPEVTHGDIIKYRISYDIVAPSDMVNFQKPFIANTTRNQRSYQTTVAQLCKSHSFLTFYRMGGREGVAYLFFFVPHVSYPPVFDGA